jgi:oligopeptide/dipeptide ABC transporter ATP-binding protein
VEPILVVRGLKTEFSTQRGILRAVDGVDLEIQKGEVLGLVGESGCGKTVTALSIMYLIPEPPGRIAGGEIWFRGLNLLAGSEEDIEVRSRGKGPPKFVPSDPLLKKHRARMNKIRGHGMSMIFQEPMSSLNPVLRVGYQVAEVLMFQRRGEICDRLLSHGDLTQADVDLFRQAVATGEAMERDRLVAEFSVRSGLRPEKIHALIDVSGLPLDERIARVQRLAARRRRGGGWWLRFLKRLDSMEETHFAREWERLSRLSLGQPAVDLFDAAKNPRAKDLPPLATVSPQPDALRLYFHAPVGSGGDRKKGDLLVPSEDLRARVEALLRDSSAGAFGAIFGIVKSVGVTQDAIELRYREPATDLFRTETELWSRRLLYRIATSIPVLRSVLARPIEEEARRHVVELFRLVRIPEPTKVYDEYPHELSGGMQQRVMIAMALAGEPALMIADEPTTALDVTTQAQILWLLKDLRTRIDSAILYITHDLAVIAELSDRVAVMYAGKIVEDAPVADLFANPLHPYTQGLLQSIVSTESQGLEPGAPLPTIPGVVPDLLAPPSGCRFHPRCKFAFDRCRIEEPKLLAHGLNRRVACHLYLEEGASAGT